MDQDSRFKDFKYFRIHNLEGKSLCLRNKSQLHLKANIQGQTLHFITKREKLQITQKEPFLT